MHTPLSVPIFQHFQNAEFYSGIIPSGRLPFIRHTDYRHPERKQPSMHGQKFNPNPKILGAAETYFVCHIGPIFQISLIYAFIGCPQSVVSTYASCSQAPTTSAELLNSPIPISRQSRFELNQAIQKIQKLAKIEKKFQ